MTYEELVDQYANQTYDSSEDIPLMELQNTDSVEVIADGGDVHIVGTLEGEANQINSDVDVI